LYGWSLKEQFSLFGDSVPAAIRVLVIVPTRELAAQCDAVFQKLTKGTGLTRGLCVGGSSVKQQGKGGFDLL
jgi:ATP-dependent RNA helicase DDX27